MEQTIENENDGRLEIELSPETNDLILHVRTFKLLFPTLFKVMKERNKEYALIQKLLDEFHFSPDENFFKKMITDLILPEITVLEACLTPEHQELWARINFGLNFIVLIFYYWLIRWLELTVEYFLSTGTSVCNNVFFAGLVILTGTSFTRTQT